MRRVLLAVVAAMTLWIPIDSANADWTISDMNKQIDQTNFVVNAGCSGTLVSLKDRYVLTANHCVADQYEDVEVERVDDKGVIKKEKMRRLRDGTVSQLDFQSGDTVRTVTYKVKVVAVDADRDLALLQVISALPNKQVSALACDEPVRGDTVYVVGNPLGRLYSSVVKGIVSSLDRDYGLIQFGGNDRAKRPLMQVSAGIIGGNSGGSVYNDRGQMIGVPVLGHRSNEILGFAVPLVEIKEFLKEKNIDESLYTCPVSDKK